MKKLLLLWFFSGSLDGFSQSTYKVFHGINGDPDTIRVDIKMESKLDTIPSTLLISAHPPAFGHAINGYCVYRQGVCTGKHLRYWRKKWKEVGPEYILWGCERVDTLKKLRGHRRKLLKKG
jgi:hypothetical protein